ncbi:acyl carrier protein [Shewanella waksmanii]|uniref:acyl carrier protein n=1 Tax=Shewanella waksmanii TaxID=213783 RepID=UPI003735A4E4
MSQLRVSEDSITQFVLEKLAIRTAIPLKDLTEDTLFSDIGVDSLKAVLICGYLEDEYELEIDPSLMFKHQSAKQVAKALIELMQGDGK